MNAPIPAPGRFEEVLAKYARDAAEIVPIVPAPAFTLHASLDGYVIRDTSRVIARFEGPQYALASKTLRLLLDEAETPVPQAA